MLVSCLVLFAQFTIKDADVDGVMFKHHGYVVDINADHAVSVTLESTATTSPVTIAATLKAGSNQVCVPRGSFAIKADSCFTFDQVCRRMLISVC